MRLMRVEALRYGALCDTALGPLAPGLNVVLGPNEAGKSTYTALVRHVLYGFPDRRRAERGYRPPGGDSRSGRLVFADDGGAEWILTRSGETGGGEVSLVGPEGPAEPEPFLESIKGGVSEEVYRQVFGFSLGELAEFDSLEGIRTHLLASVAGLETDPHAVLAEIEKRRDALYLPSGRSKTIHKLLAELRGSRTERRTLEAEAESFASQRSEVSRLSRELAEARTRGDQSAIRARMLATLMVRMTDARDRISAAREEQAATDAAIARRIEEAESIPVDEKIAGSAGATLALAERVDEVQSALDELREARAEADAARAIASEAGARVGEQYGPKDVEKLAADASLEIAIDEHNGRLGKAEEASDRAGEEISRAEGVAMTADAAAKEAAKRAGVDPEAGLTGLLGGGEPASSARSASRTRSLPLIIAAAGGILGALLAIAGLVLESMPVVVVGVALWMGVVAVVLFSLQRRGAAPQTGSAERASLEEARIRRAEADGAMRDLEGARAQLDAAGRRRSEEAESWASWRDDAGLPQGSTPAQCRGFLVSARQAAEAQSRVEKAVQRVERAERTIARHVQMAEDAGATVDESPDALPAVIRAAAVAADREQEAARRRDDAFAAVRDAREELARIVSRLGQANDDMAKILGEAGMESDAEFETALLRADEEAAEDRTRVEELAEARATVVGVLGDDGREDRQAELSLDAARTTEELRSALTEYAVNSIAAEMLSETLTVYERERQPEVVGRAEKMFAEITDGRYEQLRSPVGTFDPHIVGATGEAKDKEQLSTGTAQQLYLALRLAYLESLADSPGALPVLMDDVLVNFDEDRREETARLLAEFAASHQTVFFTCHEATAEVLSAVAADGVVTLKLTHC